MQSRTTPNARRVSVMSTTSHEGGVIFFVSCKRRRAQLNRPDLCPGRARLGRHESSTDAYHIAIGATYACAHLPGRQGRSRLGVASLPGEVEVRVACRELVERECGDAQSS